MHVFVHRESMLGVLDRGGEHLAHALRAVSLEQGQIAVDGARHGERQMRVRSGTGRDAIELAPAKESDRRERRRRALSAQRQGFPRARVVDERHAFATERVGRRRLDHRGGEAGGHGGVERVAAREQHAHARHRHERVAARDNALRARDHRARRRPVGRVMLELVDCLGRLAHRLTSAIRPRAAWPS